MQQLVSEHPFLGLLTMVASDKNKDRSGEEVDWQVFPNPRSVAENHGKHGWHE